MSEKNYNGKFSPMSIIALVLSILGCTGLIGMILGIIDVSRKDGRKKGLSIAAIVVGTIMTIVVFAAMGASPGKSTTDTTAVKELQETAEEPTDTPSLEPEIKEFEVTINANANKTDKGVSFDIDTNLPDEASLMLTISRGDYNTDDETYRASTKVTIKDGKATSDPFSNKGEPLSGDYDLCISMSLPSLQSDAVREVVGEKGENMTGPLVRSDFGANTVEALFLVSVGDDVKVSSEDDYTQTIFAEETEETEIDNTETADTETDGGELSNQEYIKKYETDIVVMAKMSLDRFIDGYKMSLAPQLWTITKFDDDDAVMAYTDITYNGKKGRYYYIGTLHFDDAGEVDSATPHYLEVNGEVLGNDGYADEFLQNISEASQYFNQ